MYKDNNSLGKLVILLLTNKKDSKEEVMDYFNCSEYQADCTCKLPDENSGLFIPQKQKQKGCCICQEKVKRFVEFVFSIGLLHDVGSLLYTVFSTF